MHAPLPRASRKLRKTPYNPHNIFCRLIPQPRQFHGRVEERNRFICSKMMHARWHVSACTEPGIYSDSSGHPLYRQLTFHNHLEPLSSTNSGKLENREGKDANRHGCMNPDDIRTGKKWSDTICLSHEDDQLYEIDF